MYVFVQVATITLLSIYCVYVFSSMGYPDNKVCYLILFLRPSVISHLMMFKDEVGLDQKEHQVHVVRPHNRRRDARELVTQVLMGTPQNQAVVHHVAEPKY